PALSRSSSQPFRNGCDGADPFWRKSLPKRVYTVMPGGQNSFGIIHIAGFGTTHYDPNATRWGDYSWATLAPDEKSVWLATEYVPPRSSQTVDQMADWGTFVMQVSV